MKIKKRVILSIILTILALIASNALWLVFKPFPVEISLKGNNSGNISAILNRKDNDLFAKTRIDSKAFNIKQNNKQKLEIKKTIFPKRFRLDFTDLNSKNEIIITKIQLSNFNLDLSKKENYIIDGGIADFTNNTIKIKPNNDSVKLTYKKRLKNSAPFDFEIELFIIILILSYLLAYKLMDYVANFKTIKNKSRIEIIFLTIFFVLLFIPMMKIDNSLISEKENRTLAKWKPLIIDGKINYTFGKDFDNWFSDRFFQREDFINLYYNQFIISKNLRTKKVIKGKDNWLFYGIQSSVNMFTNKNLFDETGLKQVAKYLTDIDEYCKKRNKKFYFMIAPSKPMIYPEFYSEVIKPDKNSKLTCANQLIDYLTKNTNIKIIYPGKNIIKNKDKGLLYFKTDTHWNEMGAYFGYETFVDVIGKDIKLKPYKFNRTQEKTESSGDLNANLPKILRIKDFEKYNKPIVEKGNYVCAKTLSETDVQYCTSNNGNKSLVMFRDSFTINLIPYIASTFKKSKYIWQKEVDSKMIQESDIIVLEVVEVDLSDLATLEFKGEQTNAF